MGRDEHTYKNAAKSRQRLVERIELWSAGAVAALAFAAWIFDWREWDLTLAVLLAPPLALAALIPLNAWFRDLPSSRRPMLFGPIVLVPPVLVFVVWSEFNFLDGGFYDWALLIPAGALLLPFFLGGEGSFVLAVAAVLFLPLMYLDGAVKLMDVDLDKAPPTTYRTTVTAKEIVDRWYLHRHSRALNYYVTFAPWGPDRIAGEIEVPGYDYDAVKVAGPICARLHRGYLRLRWYEIEPC